MHETARLKIAELPAVVPTPLPAPARLTAIGLLTLLSSCALFDTAPGTVTIRNDASVPLSQVTIIVSDETLVVQDLAPHDVVRLRYRLNRESDYNIIATFRDGRELRADIGYVAVGLRTDDVIAVGENQIYDATPWRQPST